MPRLLALLALLAACPGGQVTGDSSRGSGVSGDSSDEPGGTATPTEPAAGSTGGEPTPQPETVQFAVIGDFGLDLPAPREVAAMVARWQPEFIATLGDNNYYSGDASTIDVNIGQHYHRFIAPYRGAYGPGADKNRFFPCPGNHDWQGGTLQPYLDYFTLPGNERYYRLRRGPVELFLLDSDYNEPDGVSATSDQAQWLEAALADSTAIYQVVLMHHPPHSSGWHGGATYMRWPFAAWGADLVLAGHDHNYERLVVDGLPFLVSGTAGAALRPFEAEAPGSQRGHWDSFGALRITADASFLRVDCVAPGGALVDRMLIAASPPARWQPRITAGSSWRWREREAPADWNTPAFSDAMWISGAAPLGYGLGGEQTLLPGAGQAVRPMTTYFRRRFEAEASDLGAPLRLRIAVDDGAVVYLNGVEVYRINLPEGAINGSTRASLGVGDWFAPRLAETVIPGDSLVAGENLLAVEVHQHFAFSSDLRLDLELATAAQ